MPSQLLQAQPKLLLICQEMPFQEQPHHPLFCHTAAAPRQTHLLLIRHALQFQGQVLQLGPHFRHLHDLVDGGPLHTGWGRRQGEAGEVSSTAADCSCLAGTCPPHQPNTSTPAVIEVQSRTAHSV